MGITYNHDIASIVARLDRFIAELKNSVSSGVAEINQFDLVRIRSYLDALITFVSWADGQPQLDLPESHPKASEIAEPTAIPDIENESVVDLIRLLLIARDELVNSASSRKPSGFIKFDLARFMAMISKSAKFLDEFVAKALPMDLPESSPKAPMTEAGKRGV